MRSLLGWAVTGLLVAVASVLSAAPAAAHPTDEVVQQVYLTPAASGLEVRLDLTPGVLVAPQFTAAVDPDGDGVLSAAEVDAHAAAVQSAVTAQVDGRAVDLTLTGKAYPPADLLAAAGGTITLQWRGELPADAHQVVFTDRYEPGGRPAVQMSVLVADDPVELGRIGHADEGRTMTVAINPSTLDPGTATAPGAAAGPAGIPTLRGQFLPTVGWSTHCASR